MNKHTYDCIATLQSLGITYDDATALRRISMTLHRWHEMECGDSNDYCSRSLVRGHRNCVIMLDGTKERGFNYCDDGAPELCKPFIEQHNHTDTKARYYPIPDRETGALKRLAKIMAQYPMLSAYVQGDPRGAALYILRPGDVPEGKDVDAYYSRGIAVYK